jgi:hypothetical protein
MSHSTLSGKVDPVFFRVADLFEGSFVIHRRERRLDRGTICA